MKEQPTEQQLDRFRNLILSSLGLNFDHSHQRLLTEVLTRRCQKLQTGIEGYFVFLAQDSGQELRALAQEMTVGETYFFRHAEQMAAYLQEALPRSNAERIAKNPLQVLSAGCSSGEEPYSLAMLAHHSGLRAQDIIFQAADINPKALLKAQSGTYSSWSLRDSPEEFRGRWFRKVGSNYKLDPEIVSSVKFREFNLLQKDKDIWRSQFYDIIFCRNVLMYFSPQQARVVVAHIEDSLRPGGYLFLGHVETLRGLSDNFRLVNTHNCFYYQKEPKNEAQLSLSSRPPNALDTAPLPEDWGDSIRAASERIRQLGEIPETKPSPTGLPDLSQVREFHQNEQYDTARKLLRELPLDAREHPESILLHAVLGVQLGDFQETEQLCLSLLSHQSFAAGAHYLLGLCGEGKGESEAAACEHRVAVRLDPGFPMPRLQLGILARRAKDLVTARKEFEKALFLLEGEELSRLRLFGGGFGREGLMALCRSELNLCGGAK